MAGATWNIVVLSSSPPLAPLSATPSPQNASPARRVTMPASSPPDLSLLVSARSETAGAFRINNCDAAIPEGTPRGLATVSHLIQSECFTQPTKDDADNIDNGRQYQHLLASVQGASVATKKSGKLAARKGSIAKGEQPKSKPRTRKPKLEKQIDANDPELRLPSPVKSYHFQAEPRETIFTIPGNGQNAETTLTLSGKPRKARTKKRKSEDGEVAQEPKPKIRTVRRSKTQSAPTASAHFDQSTDKNEGIEVARDLHVESHAGAENERPAPQRSCEATQEGKSVSQTYKAPASINEDLGLESAVARRRDWTPPPADTIEQISDANSAGKEKTLMPLNTFGNFNQFVSNFAYAPSSSVQNNDLSKSNGTDLTAATTKRLVGAAEVVGGLATTKHSSSEKQKAPKKKPRTITDIVTDQYIQRNQVEDVESLTENIFEIRTATTKIILNDVQPAKSKPLRKTAQRRCTNSKSDSEKSSTKPKTKKVSAKSVKSKLVAEKLLSPTSALQRLQQQDVLFGTSSQLALDETSATIREIQLALEQSERECRLSPTSLHGKWSKLDRIKGKKSLWAASARVGDGDVLENLGDIRVSAQASTGDVSSPGANSYEEPANHQSQLDISDLDSSTIVLISSDFPTPPPSIVQPSQTIRSDKTDKSNVKVPRLLFDNANSDEQQPPPSNQVGASQIIFVDIDDIDRPPSTQMQSHAIANPRPRALSRSLSSGSPNKHRGRPSNPESAGQSKIQLTRSTSKTKAPVKVNSTPPVLSPLPNRFTGIDKILDSEDEALEILSPTPPRARKHVDSSPLPLISFDPSPAKKTPHPSADPSLTPIFIKLSQDLQWEHIKPRVFAAITIHIRSLPPTTDPKNPSWHERILMYEPIVIEDFVAYINASTSIRTCKKATQKQVKVWNAMLKKKGEAGLSVGASGEEVLAVERELEASMVQGWCESLSVCCIWREGRGKGGARKGLY